jgi:hypothetical protein
MKTIITYGLLCLGLLGSNGYIYWLTLQAREDLSNCEAQLAQKTSLLRFAKTQDRKEDTGISHRLALPTSRLSASEDFQELSQTLKLARLDFQISPEKPINLPTMESFSESTVELKFQNKTDQALFQMIHHLCQEFPGMILPQEITIHREDQTDEPLIQGTFRFLWLKKIEDSQTP